MSGDSEMGTTRAQGTRSKTCATHSRDSVGESAPPAQPTESSPILCAPCGSTAHSDICSADDRVLIRLDGLTAGYRQPVVGPLSLSLRRGERLGVWGPNGTGKSTLLKAIGHAAQVFAGTIERASGLRVVYLDQQPVRLPAMPITGRELLRAAGATEQGAPEALAAILKRRIDRLSGGQYQLLWIWSALAAAADLVLLDEPTNNLDPGRRDQLIEILMTRPSDQALILVSHDRDFLQRTCSHLLDLEDGEVRHA